MTGPTSRRAASDIAVQLVGRLGNLALGVVVTLAVVRALGDKAFGQWSTALAVAQVAWAFGDLGLETVAVTRAARGGDDSGRWLGAVITLRLALGLPVTLVSIGALLLIADTNAMRIAGTILSLTLLVSALNSTKAVFQLRTRNDIAVIVMTVNSVVWGAGALLIAGLNGGMVAFAIAFTGAAFLSTALQSLMALRTGDIDWSGARALWGPLLRLGLPVAIAGLLVTAYVRIDQVIVFELAGSRESGLYAAVFRIVDQAQFVPAVVMTTLLPMIAAGWPGDAPRVRALSQTGAELMAAASLPALAFAIAAATPIVTLLFGEQFAAAGPALPVMLGAFVCIAFGHLVGSLRIVLGLQRAFVSYAAIGLVFNVTANLALVPSQGFRAAAWITFVTELLVLGLMARDVLRTLAMTVALGRLARIAAASATMGVVVFLLRRHGDVNVGVLAVTALVSYSVVLLALRAVTPAEVRAIAARGK